MRFAFVVLPALLTGCDASTTATNAEKARPFTVANNETWKNVKALECRPARVDACGLDGCKEGKPVVTVRWETTGSYARCDEDGCDSYNPVVSYSGVWTLVSVPGRGTLAKFAPNGSYVEIATINDSALIYRGQCRRVMRM